jgi:hypothetical protein
MHCPAGQHPRQSLTWDVGPVHMASLWRLCHLSMWWVPRLLACYPTGKTCCFSRWTANQIPVWNSAEPLSCSRCFTSSASPVWDLQRDMQTQLEANPSLIVSCPTCHSAGRPRPQPGYGAICTAQGTGQQQDQRQCDCSAGEKCDPRAIGGAGASSV